MRTAAIFGCALFPLAMLQAGAAIAADSWETVLRDRNRQIQIDRGSIIQSDRGTKVAWARVLLSPAEAAAQGYANIQALNRFDCLNRSVETVKRRYLDERNIVVKEEDVADPRPLLVTRNSVDERLWREVCQPPSAGDLDRIAEEAARVAAALGAPPARVQPGLEPPAGATAMASAAAPVPPATTAARRQAQPEVPVRDVTAAPAAAPPVLPSRPEVVLSRFAPSSETTPGATPAPASQWSYRGETGPDRWGRMRPEWAVCADGTRQSPIELTGGIAVDLEPVVFDYRSTRFLISDVGHTLEVHVGEGLGVHIRGQRYELVHFQFHRPAQERIGGRSHDMSVHLHHQDAEGRMAIVAIQLEAGDQPQPLIQTLWNSLPLDRGDHYMPTVMIDPSALVPVNPAHYLYMGSLTTPPCTEGVIWVVMKDPISISHGQMRIFERLYPHNSRPVQALNDRLVLESR
ncbi:MAG TPA: carbonic anhydrase family protein [Rhodocyclaceae bacterium]|nr:carbonic anhydrase family protein [Rhodocyclaceae bacterium]HRQ47914.1 carbonic anhydrase family protein [Rhodocyclaceae bacterium]